MADHDAPPPTNARPGDPALDPVPPGRAARRDGDALGRELGGSLPCVVCGYNLQGLSIRSMCPECGVGVRATILALVDPMASELQPVRFSRLIAAGVVLWAAGAAGAAVMSWLPHAADLLMTVGVPGLRRPSATLGVALGIAASGAGSLALIRPHTGIGAVRSVLAATASLLYIPLLWAAWRYQMLMDLTGGPKYFAGWWPSTTATVLLVTVCALICAIIMLQRPIARMLVARSLVIRTGRVDRQTMYAMALAAAIMGVGAALGGMMRAESQTYAEATRIVGVVVIATGSMLLTVGLFGSLIDSVRVAGALLLPQPTLRQVIRQGRPVPKSRLLRALDRAQHAPRSMNPSPTPPPGPEGQGPRS